MASDTRGFHDARTTIALGEQIFLPHDDFPFCADSGAHPLNLMLFSEIPHGNVGMSHTSSSRRPQHTGTEILDQQIAQELPAPRLEAIL
jgi:hypothetical protein